MCVRQAYCSAYLPPTSYRLLPTYPTHPPAYLPTQAYCSALAVGYSEGSEEAWAPLARLVLEASYEAVQPLTILTLPTAHCSLLTTQYSPLTPHPSPLTSHLSLLTAHYPLLTARRSLPTTHYRRATRRCCFAPRSTRQRGKAADSPCSRSWEAASSAIRPSG